MTIEQFKKLNSKEREEYGKNIPLGSRYDKLGNVLTCKYDNTGYWEEFTYDENGNHLTYKNNNGNWTERTYDENGNQLTYRDNDGYWNELTYDDKGNEITFRNSNGDYKILGQKITKEVFNQITKGDK